MIEELQYDLATNKRRIEYELKNVEEELEKLKKIISSGEFDGARLLGWTDGFVARDIGRISSLIMKQLVMQETIYIVKRIQQEGKI